jgi:hypothetical protein
MQLFNEAVKKLDVYAVQSNPEDIVSALSNVIKEGSNYLFTNAVCCFKVAGGKIPALDFNTTFYSPANDLLVLFLRTGITNLKQIEQYLNNQHIPYMPIECFPLSTEMPNEGLPEIWIARDISVLSQALDNSIERKAFNSCNYYTKLDSSLSIEYRFNNPIAGMQLNTPLVTEIKRDSRQFKGLILLQDKLVFLIDDPDEFSVDRVLKSIESYGFGHSDYNNDSDIPQCLQIRNSKTR